LQGVYFAVGVGQRRNSPIGLRFDVAVEFGALFPVVEFLGEEDGNLAGVHGREVVVEAELLQDQGETLDGTWQPA